MRRHSHSGFTLIELSIVLVIIGLLVGGVLVGRDLIESARLRSQVTQIEQYVTAINTFKLKYNAIPGDMANATAFWSGSANGDGNGDLRGKDYGASDNAFCFSWLAGTAGDTSNELTRFWDHLSLAGLIGFSPAFSANAAARFYLPELKALPGSYLLATCVRITETGGSNYPIGTITGPGNFFILATGTNETSFQLSLPMYMTPGGHGGPTGPQLTNAQALYLDSKMDDSIPNSGRIVVINGCNYGFGSYVINTGACGGGGFGGSTNNTLSYKWQ